MEYLTTYIRKEIENLTDHLQVIKNDVIFSIDYVDFVLNQSLFEKIEYYHNTPKLLTQENYH
jgi:hypothetical protein